MADTDLRNKRVLIREDLNVPVQDGVVTSDARIRAALATIRYALDQHAKVFVMSHLGRPEGGQYDRSAVAGAGGGAPLGPARQAGAAAQGLARRRRLPAGQRGAVRERALQQGREAGQRAAGAAHGGAVRSVRHGRLRHGASRRGQHPRGSALRAGGLRGTRCWWGSWRRWSARCRSRPGRWWRSSAARRSPPSSRCSSRCWRKSTS